MEFKLEYNMLFSDIIISEKNIYHPQIKLLFIFLSKTIFVYMSIFMIKTQFWSDRLI